MNTIKSIQGFYTKYNSNILFGVGTLFSGATLMYIIDDCHKSEINKLKKLHNDEIQKLYSELTSKRFNCNNDKSNVF